MKKISTKILFIIAIGLVLMAGSLLFFDYYASEAKAAACQDHDFAGFAWSSNIGWISFSCKNQDTGVDYGVDKDTNGDLSGYAWSSNIGWISFNAADLAGCPQGSCNAKLAGNNLQGWARAAKAINSGGQTLGGWDGWIKLSGSGYGGVLSGNEFTGWAWGGDDDLREASIGWISLNCLDRGVCGQSDYKVFLPNSAPVISLACDPASCSGYANVPRGTEGFLDIVYSVTDPDNDIQSCDFQIDGTTQSTACSNTFLVTGRGLGDHTASVEAADMSGESGVSSILFTIKKDIVADFDCSLDNVAFQACSSIFPKLNQTVYFQDTSAPSDGAVINDWSWTFQNGEIASSTDQHPGVRFIASGVNNVTLRVADDQGRTDSDTQAIDVESRLKPQWKEWIPR